MALCADACISWENWGAQPAETAAFIQTQRGEPGTFVNIWEHLWTYGNIWEHMGTYGNIWEHMVTYGNLGPELPRMSGSTECEEVRRKPRNEPKSYILRVTVLNSSLPWRCEPWHFSREAQVARLLQPPEAEWCCFVFKTWCETRSKFTYACHPGICKCGSD